MEAVTNNFLFQYENMLESNIPVYIRYFSHWHDSTDDIEDQYCYLMKDYRPVEGREKQVTLEELLSNIGKPQTKQHFHFRGRYEN